VAVSWFALQETCLGTLSFMEAHRLVEMALGYVFVKVCNHPFEFLATDFKSLPSTALKAVSPASRAFIDSKERAMPRPRTSPCPGNRALK